LKEESKVMKKSTNSSQFVMKMEVLLSKKMLSQMQLSLSLHKETTHIMLLNSNLKAAV